MNSIGNEMINRAMHVTPTRNTLSEVAKSNRDDLHKQVFNNNDLHDKQLPREISVSMKKVLMKSVEEHKQLIKQYGK